MGRQRQSEDEEGPRAESKSHSQVPGTWLEHAFEVARKRGGEPDPASKLLLLRDRQLQESDGARTESAAGPVRSGTTTEGKTQ